MTESVVLAATLPDGGVLSLPVSYAAPPSRAPFRFGVSYANGAVAANNRRIGLGNNGCVRIYSGGDPTSWTSPYVLSTLSGCRQDAILHFSFKATPTQANTQPLFDGIPAGKKIVLTWHHEDEQQTGGDVPISDYKAGWRALRALRDAHPRRDDIELVGIVTEYRCAFVGENWRDWRTGYEDRMAIDVYNATPTGNDYRAEEDIWKVAAEIAADQGKPVLVAEYGCDIKAGDTDGIGRALCVLEQVAWAREHPDVIDGISWFGYGSLLPSTDARLEGVLASLCETQ